MTAMKTSTSKRKPPRKPKKNPDPTMFDGLRDGIASRVGERLNALREKRGMTQAELAAAVGHKYHTGVIYYLSGKKIPSIPMLVLLANALGVKPSKLLD